MTSIGKYPDLELRRVLVTGASSGIGLAAAEAFLSQGARVAAHFRSQREIVEALSRRYPDRVYPVQADLSEEGSCVLAVRKAVEALGGLDVLVHSAGIWTDGPIREMTAETLEKAFKVNTFSAYYLSREAAKVMESGSLIFIGSTAGQRGEPGHSHYAGSKGAVQSLVYSLAQELAPAARTWSPRGGFEPPWPGRPFRPGKRLSAGQFR
jgi:3-oxoacyl-[acyl-carrier protein] reductase